MQLFSKPLARLSTRVPGGAKSGYEALRERYKLIQRQNSANNRFLRVSPYKNWNAEHTKRETSRKPTFIVSVWSECECLTVNLSESSWIYERDFVRNAQNEATCAVNLVDRLQRKRT